MRYNPAIPLAALLLAATVLAQDPRQGPIQPPPGRDVKRIPAGAPPEPPPIPTEQIIERFLQKEAETKQAHERFNYRLTVRVQEFDESGSAAGDWRVTSDIVFKPDGTRVGRVIEQPTSTLKRSDFTLEDLQEMAGLPQFILTPDARDRYEIAYQGMQPLDELKTYIFQVRPRRMERKLLQFEGLVWVEDRDFAIVKMYGRMVREVEDDSPSLPFQFYETYRENVEGKYWFPTYTRSDDTLKSELGDTKLRLTIRSSDFRPREN